METSPKQTVEKEAEQQAEGLRGVGAGEVSTPTERSKRRRTASEGTPPEREETGVLEDTGLAIVGAVEELRGYLAKNFAPKHSSYFEKRFKTIITAHAALEADKRRISQVVGRIQQVEKELRGLRELDWGKEVVRVVREEVEDLGRTIAGEILRRNQETLDKIRGQVDGALETITAHDAEMGKEVDKVETAFKEGMCKVSKELKQVTRECEIGRGFMNEVRGDLDKLYERVGAVHEVVDPLEHNVLKEVNRRLDCMNVERVEEKMVIAVEAVVSKVGESVSAARVERMEVEESRETDWVSIAKKGRRGPKVIVEVPGVKGFKEKKEEVVKALDPKAGEVRVRSLRRKGKDVVMDVKDKDDVEKLGECVGGKGMKVKGLDGWRMPRVKIYDVAAELR